MKWVFVIMLGISFMNVRAGDIEKAPLSTSFFEASANQAKRAEFHDFLKSVKSKSTVLRAYYGASKALMAEVVSNPYSKLSYFKEGKELIEDAIKSDPNDAELRYVRFMIQQNTPDFLDYNGEMERDFAYLKTSIQNSEMKTTWMLEFSQYLKANNSKYKVSEL